MIVEKNNEQPKERVNNQEKDNLKETCKECMNFKNIYMKLKKMKDVISKN